MKSSQRYPLLKGGLLEYLEIASDRSVGQIQLNKLGEAANLARRIAAEIEDVVKLRAEALFAGWVLDQRRRLAAEELELQEEAA